MQLSVKLKQQAKQLKSEAQVLIIVYRDKRTSITAKILIAITVGYLLSPIDLVPDFIPVLGLLDDLIIVPLLISISLKLIPRHILSDARESVKNNAGTLKKTNWDFCHTHYYNLVVIAIFRLQAFQLLMVMIIVLFYFT